MSASAAPVATHALQPPSCLNCGAALLGPYCAHCGQKAAPIDLSLREFVQESTQELTNLEGRVPRTIAALLSRPGRLTADLLAGRRARWLAPLRVYLICSLLYFVSNPVAEAINPREGRAWAQVQITDTDAGGPGTLSPSARQALERSHYAAHLYLALHLHAAWFAALAIATVGSIPFDTLHVPIALSLAAYGYIVAHTLLAFRTVFADRWPHIIAKSVAIGAVYLSMLGVVGFALLGLAVLRM